MRFDPTLLLTTLTGTLPILLLGCAERTNPPADREAYAATALESPLCLPDLDGRITSSEIGAAFGVPVSYLISPGGTEREVDLLGVSADDGARVWDWSVDLADDQVLTVAARPIADFWFADELPAGSLQGAEFVVPLDAGGSILGIYRQDEAGLWLLGRASALEKPPEGRTLLSYESPVAVHRYPLEEGMQWVSVGVVENATLQGLPFAGQEVYEVQVSASGRLELPDLILTDVLQVRTRLTVDSAVGGSATIRQVSFLFECFGEVARATSHPGEPEEDFTIAAEVRRLGIMVPVAN
jgi:hypothetical protein